MRLKQRKTPSTQLLLHISDQLNNDVRVDSPAANFELPTDIFLHVLRLLPGQTVAVSCCVCKQWGYAIDVDSGLWRELFDRDFGIRCGDANPEGSWKRAYAFEHTWRFGRITTKRMKAERNKTTSMAFSGNVIVTGSEDGVVRVWDATSGKRVKSLEGHLGRVTVIDYDGDTIVSASDDRTIRMWRRRKGVRGGYHVKVLREIDCNRLLVNGRWAIVGEGLGFVNSWDTQNGRFIRVCQSKGVSSLIRFNGDDIISHSGEGVIKIWAAESGECVHTLNLGCPIHKICMEEGGSRILCVCEEMIQAWCVKSGDHVRSFKLTSVVNYRMPPTWFVAFANGKGVLGHMLGSTIIVLDIDSGKRMKTLRGHTNRVTKVALKGHKVVSGSWDGVVKLWDLDRGQCLRTIEAQGWNVNMLQFDGKRIMCGTGDNSFHFWSADSVIENHKPGRSGFLKRCWNFLGHLFLEMFGSIDNYYAQGERE